MAVFKVVNPGDKIDFFGCTEVTVERIIERGVAKNEQGIRFICLRRADIQRCKRKVPGYFSAIGLGSSLHPNELSQINNGKTGCYKNWPQLAKEAFTSLSTECAKSTGTRMGFGLGCLAATGPKGMANRCCPGSETLRECNRLRSAKSPSCNLKRICNTIHSTGRAADVWGTTDTYCFPDPYDATNHQIGRAAAWFCWVKNAHRFKINNISNEYWHWEWHGHLDTTDSKNPPEPAINSDGSINTDAQGDNSQVSDDTTDLPSESDSTNFDFSDTLGEDWTDVPDDYGSLEGIEQVLSLDRFQTADMFKGVVFLKDDENILSNERFDNANALRRYDGTAIIDGNQAYMTSIDELWSQIPVDQNPKVIQAQEDLEKLRAKLAKLSLDSEERKKSLEEIKVILTKITPESDLEMVGIEEDELVKLINKYKETGNPVATSLENILNDTRKKKDQTETTTTSETSGTSGTAGTSGTTSTTNTSQNNISVPESSTEVQSTVSGGIVKLGCNAIKLQRDIPRISIGYGAIEPLKDAKGTQEIGTSGGTAPKWEVLVGRGNNRGETLENYIKKNDYGGKYNEVVTVTKTKGTGANKTTVQEQVAGNPTNFPFWKDKYKNFVNLSLYEIRNTGWGSGQPTGAFIVNGKYYGAKPKQFIPGFPALAIVNGQVEFVQYGSKIIDKDSLIPKSGVTMAAPGSYLIINDNKVSTSNTSKSTAWPFVGRVIAKNGTKTFFAGAGNGYPKDIAQCILNYFNQEDTKVDKCILGDGGGSTCFVVNGQNIIGGRRPFPVVVYW
jgi:hypothetical protein